MNRKREPDLDQEKRAQEKLLSSNPEIAELTPCSSFEIFGDIIDLLVEQTNLYAKRDRHKMNFSISKEEMINFIGLIFLSGYNIRKSTRDYWSVDPDLGCSSFRDTMSQNPFEEIESVFHVADNAFLEQDSRISKVKLIYDYDQRKYCAVWHFTRIPECRQINGAVFQSTFMETVHKIKTSSLWFQTLGSCQLNRYAVQSSHP